MKAFLIVNVYKMYISYCLSYETNNISVLSQIKEMTNHLTVPAAPPDSPTMRRARVASGKFIHLGFSSPNTVATVRYSLKQKRKIHRVTNGFQTDLTLYFVGVTLRLFTPSVIDISLTNGNMFACASQHVNQCMVSF